MNKLILTILSILLVIAPVIALDSQTILTCGGDNETIILCLGDEQNSFIGTKFSSEGGQQVVSGSTQTSISSLSLEKVDVELEILSDLNTFELSIVILLTFLVLFFIIIVISSTINKRKPKQLNTN